MTFTFNHHLIISTGVVKQLVPQMSVRYGPKSCIKDLNLRFSIDHEGTPNHRVLIGASLVSSAVLVLLTRQYNRKVMGFSSKGELICMLITL